MAEPALHPRPAGPGRPALGRVLAIASGKGGVGKTWLAITLAHAMAGAGQRVLLFDGDLGLANIDVQLGLAGACDLGNVVAGTLSLADAIQRHPGGFDILAGRSGSGALSALPPADLERILAGLRLVAGQYDVTLVDLGAGLERPVRRLALFADTLLVVVTDEPTSLTDAYAVLKTYKADRAGRIGTPQVVVNMAASRQAGRRTFEALARASATFLGCAPALAGAVRRDEHVRDAIRRQALLLVRHPGCAAATDVGEICDGLCRLLG